MKEISKKHRQEQGATMVEYVLALVLLIAVFVIAGRMLEKRSEERYENSTQVVTGMAPCGGSGAELSGAECY